MVLHRVHLLGGGGARMAYIMSLQFLYVPPARLGLKRQMQNLLLLHMHTGQTPHGLCSGRPVPLLGIAPTAGGAAQLCVHRRVSLRAPSRTWLILSMSPPLLTISHLMSSARNTSRATPTPTLDTRPAT